MSACPPHQPHSRRRPVGSAEPVSGTPPTSTVAVVCEPRHRRVLARVHGEIDMEGADGLRQDLTAALESSSAGLDLDLSAVTFCDSSGLNLLLGLNRLALSKGKTLELTALSPRVARLLWLTGAQQVFTIRT